MSSSRLPRLERGVVVTADAARHDRLMIEVGDWSFDGDDADISIVMSNLSAHFSMPGTLGGEIDQPVFRAPQGRGWPKRVQFRELERSGVRRVGAPLIGGYLLVSKVRSETGFRFTMRFYLSLNPTRFVAHQRSRRELVDGGVSVETVAPVSLLTRRLSVAGELSLYNDNVLIGVRAAVMSRPALWPLWLEAYLDAVVRSLHETMNSAFSVAISAPLRHSHHYAATEVESYWEFQSPDPIRTVHDLTASFTSFASAAGVQLYRSQPDAAGVEHNSPVVTLSAGTGRKIKAYAKATQRVRLEVVHNLRKVTGFGPHTTTNAVEMLDMLLRATELGASNLNLLLRHIDSALPSEGEEQLPPYAMVAAVIRAAPDPQVHSPLLSILVNLGAISLRPNSEFRAAVEALSRTGDVKPTRPYGRTFRLASKYSDARSTLRARQAH